MRHSGRLRFAVRPLRCRSKAVCCPSARLIVNRVHPVLLRPHPGTRAPAPDPDLCAVLSPNRDDFLTA
jgi:hypothetical protein